jgi:hypothetical protein
LNPGRVLACHRPFTKPHDAAVDRVMVAKYWFWGMGMDWILNPVGFCFRLKKISN